MLKTLTLAAVLATSILSMASVSANAATKHFGVSIDANLPVGTFYDNRLSLRDYAGHN